MLLLNFLLLHTNSLTNTRLNVALKTEKMTGYFSGSPRGFQHDEQLIRVWKVVLSVWFHELLRRCDWVRTPYSKLPG